MNLDLDIALARPARDLHGVAHALTQHYAGPRCTEPPVRLLRKTGDLVTAIDVLNLLCFAIIVGGLGTIALGLLL